MQYQQEISTNGPQYLRTRDTEGSVRIELKPNLQKAAVHQIFQRVFFLIYLCNYRLHVLASSNFLKYTLVRDGLHEVSFPFGHETLKTVNYRNHSIIEYLPYVYETRKYLLRMNTVTTQGDRCFDTAKTI